jgi:hypothetical protein
MLRIDILGAQLLSIMSACLDNARADSVPTIAITAVVSRNVKPPWCFDTLDPLARAP